MTDNNLKQADITNTNVSEILKIYLTARGQVEVKLMHGVVPPETHSAKDRNREIPFCQKKMDDLAGGVGAGGGVVSGTGGTPGTSGIGKLDISIVSGPMRMYDAPARSAIVALDSISTATPALICTATPALSA